MRGNATVLSLLLLILLTVSLSVVSWSGISDLISGYGKDQAVQMASGLFNIVSARMTTPYTWQVWIQNLSAESVEIGDLEVVVYKNGKVCGISQGLIADTNTISPHSVKQVLFYGELTCRLGSGQWELELHTPAGFATRVATEEPGDVYLWLPFRSVHNMDWSGKHEIYFHSDEHLATLYGPSDGNAYGFSSWEAHIKPGMRGDALWFDATPGQKIKGGMLPFPPTDSNYVTVAFWMYWDGKTNVMPFGWDTQYDLWIRDYGCFGFNTGAGDCLGIPATGLANRWVHVAAVFPIESNFAKWPPRLYIDGQLQSLHQSGSYNPTHTITPVVHVSGWGANNLYIFRGRIDDVHIYNRALSDEEIRALYQGKDIRDGLVLYYTFDRNTIDVDNNKVYDVHMWGPGRIDGGLYFSESNTEVVSFQTPLSPEDDQTYVVWFNVGKDNSGVVFSDYASPETYVGVFGTHYKACVNSICAVVNVPVKKGWHFAAVSYTETDKDMNRGTVQFFLALPDGHTYYKEKNGTYSNPAEVSSIGLHCGHYTSRCENYATPERIFSGQIDEFRIYKRVLSQKEIRCIYENPECLIDDEDLVVYYTFDYPDKAWQGVPDWHHASKAPRLRRGDRGAYLDTNGESVLFVSDYTLYRKKDFTDIVVLEPKDFNNVASWTKLYNYGRYWSDTNVGYIFVVRDDATVPDYFETSVRGNTDSEHIWCFYNSGPLAFTTRVMQWLADERNVQIIENGSLKRACHFPDDANTPFNWIPPENDSRRPWFEHLTIGGTYALSEKGFARYYLILAVDNALNDLELNAICKLFGTC